MQKTPYLCWFCVAVKTGPEVGLKHEQAQRNVNQQTLNVIIIIITEIDSDPSAGIWVKSQTTNAWPRSVEADRNIAFMSKNSLQSKFKFTIRNRLVSREWQYRLYNSVLTCRHRPIHSSASAPLNATNVAAVNVSHVEEVRVGSELLFSIYKCCFLAGVFSPALLGCVTFSCTLTVTWFDRAWRAGRAGIRPSNWLVGGSNLLPGGL